MQAAGHEALQEMNEKTLMRLNNITLDMQSLAPFIPSNYAKSFIRVQAILKAYVLPIQPYYVCDISGALPPEQINLGAEEWGFLHKATSLVFDSAMYEMSDDIVFYGYTTTLEFISEGGIISRVCFMMEGGQLMSSLTIRSNLIPRTTHTMHDLSELASLYDIDSNESLASVKEKVGQHLDKDDDVTYYELDHNYLECLVERRAAP